MSCCDAVWIFLMNPFQENTLTIDNQVSTQDGQETSAVTQTERKVTVTVENDLVSQAKEEEEDMEALLDTLVHASYM